MDDDDDDVETYFAYSSDDMLPSKVDVSVTATDPSYGQGGNSSQVAETSIPNFLLKLWKLVEDERYNQCIEWDATGFSFHVREPYGFSKDVLPLYFKHSNLNSFIRQLNMYGFRKVTNLEKGALKQQTDQDSLEFQHPYFVRGHPELLQYIKRKISNPRTAGELDVQQYSSNVRGLNHVLEDLRQLREKQVGMDAKLSHIKKENGTLWREVAHMRQMHMKQQQVVNKLIQFLLSLVQPASGKRLGKRQLLVIGPGLLAEQHQQDRDDQPAKRPRSDSVNSPCNAAQIIESLEQELQNSGRLSFVAPAGARASFGGGPIIADVTDEPEHYDMNDQRQRNLTCGPPQLQTDSATTMSSGGYPRPVAPTTSESDESILHDPTSARNLEDLAFEALSPSGIGNFKEPGTFVNLASTAPTSTPYQQPKSLSPQSIQPNHQGSTAVIQRQQPQPRAILNRSISDSGSTSASTIYSTSDWMPKPGPVPEAEPARWSKPEFSDYLDFVQTDLDSLRDFLTSGSLNVDNDSLSNLFTIADETSNMAAESAQQLPAEIVGNELQVYKRPELLVNFEGAIGPNGGGINYETQPIPANPVGRINMTTAGPIPNMVTTSSTPRTVAMAQGTTMPQSVLYHHHQQPRPNAPERSQSPPRPMMQVGIHHPTMTPSSPLITPPTNVVNQPVFVVSAPQQASVLRNPAPHVQIPNQADDPRDGSRPRVGSRGDHGDYVHQISITNCHVRQTYGTIEETDIRRISTPDSSDEFAYLESVLANADGRIGTSSNLLSASSDVLAIVEIITKSRFLPRRASRFQGRNAAVMRNSWQVHTEDRRRQESHVEENWTRLIFFWIVVINQPCRIAQ